MSAARERILGQVRTRLARTGPPPVAELDARLAAHRPNLVPARAEAGGEARLALFAEMAEAAQCEVRRLGGWAEVPATVARWLGAHNLPSDLAVAPDPRLAAIPWADEPLLGVRLDGAQAHDAVGLALADAGIAETGTLMLASSRHSPTTLSFLPENHIVVVPAGAVVGCYEEAWTLLREARGGDTHFTMPPTVNLITGPSRTADIALKIELGAHGPRRLCVLIVAEPLPRTGDGA
jgi:L-lactate dehydrogenase complex protein LldG